MQQTKRLPSVQLSRDLFSGFIADGVETNLQVVAGPASGRLTVRRIAVDSAVKQPDLAQAVCSVLRTRHALVAVPAPGAGSELFVCAPHEVTISSVKGTELDATI